MDKGDYVVITEEAGATRPKRRLAKVAKVGATITGYAPDRFIDDKSLRTVYDFKIEDVVANLGPNPVWGTAYGVKVEPYIGKLELRPWGVCDSYRKLTASEEKTFKTTMRKCGVEVKKMGLDGAMPIQLEVRQPPPGNGEVGLYTVHRQGVDSLAIKCPDMSAGEIRYIFWHEWGHHLWYRYMTDKMRARWVKMYHSAVKTHKTSAAKIARFRIDLVEHGSISAMKNSFSDEDEDAEAFDTVLSWMGDSQNLRSKDINLLLADGDDLKKLWPTTADVITGEAEPLVSEYGKKNVEEMFSEALAYYMTKRELNAKVKTLVVKHLKLMKARGPVNVTDDE
jgi:hypothetical protein